MNPQQLTLGHDHYKLGPLLKKNLKKKISGDSLNYYPPILVPSSAKRIATQILVIAKLNARKNFLLRDFVFNIICPYKELPIQS